MNKKKKLITIMIYLIISIAIVFTGCGQKEQENSSSTQSSTAKESKKAPKQLTDMEKSIENIIMNLNGPAVGAKENKGGGSSSESSKQSTKSEGTSSQSTGTGSSDSGGTKSQGTSSEGTASQGTASQGTGSQKESTSSKQSTKASAKAKPVSPWEKINPIMLEMHNKWNSFMPEAAKKGASRELLDNFSNALNNLSSTIVTQNKSNTLLSANSVYSFIPDFYSLYESPISPEIKKIRYQIRNIILYADAEGWDKASNDLNKLKTTWSLFKNSINKEQQDIMHKLDFSIYELENVIKNKSKLLVGIKGKVSLTNVEALEKASKKSEE